MAGLVNEGGGAVAVGRDASLPDTLIQLVHEGARSAAGGSVPAASRM